MKKITGFLMALALLSGSAFAQKNIQDANAEKRSVGSFHGIEVATGITLTLTAGNTEEVAVSAATTEFRDKILTTVENGILRIRYESKSGSINKKKESKELRAYVSYKTLDLLHATTGAQVSWDGALQASSLDLAATTGAIVKGEIRATGLKVDQSTGSKINLSGEAGTLNVEGSTGSKFEAEDMATSNCTVKVSTGARVAVKAEKELQVNASTGGNVKYKGSPSLRDVKTSTGGSVSKI